MGKTQSQMKSHRTPVYRPVNIIRHKHSVKLAICLFSLNFVRIMNFTQVVTVFIFTVLVLTYIQAQCMDDAAQREEARYIQYCDCSRQSLSNTGISNESLQFSLAKLDTLEALQKYDTEIGQNVKSEVQNVKVDIGNVKSEVENVKSEVQNVKNEVQYVKSDVGTVRSEVNNLTRQVHLVTQTNFQQTETLERLTNRTERRFSDVDTSLSSTLAILQGMNSTLVHLAQRIHLLETRTGNNRMSHV